MHKPQKLVDLSFSLGPSGSEIMPVEIEYMGHTLGGRHLSELAGVAQSNLPDSMAWASERVRAGTHCGTHADAPFHYSPLCAGEPSRTIDDLPVDWFFAPAICIKVNPDLRLGRIGLPELEEAEKQLGYLIQQPNIVLFNTGAGAKYSEPEYNDCGRGLSSELVELLCKRSVKVIGTDAWSIDPPLREMRLELDKLGVSSLWAAHYSGRKYEFSAIERLCNLDLLPLSGFWLSCFPVKISRGSAAWVRAVALFF